MQGGALMPARSWILIFALAGGSISLAIAVAGVVGICLVFGAQQIVTWVRGMFGV